MAHVSGTEWELPVVLYGMFGLRLSEIYGLRWRNVNMEQGKFSVVEQLPKLPADTTIVNEMSPVKGKGANKAGERVLPITDATRPYFLRHRALQERQRELATISGTYYENDLVVAKPNGTPYQQNRVSSNFGQMIRRSGLPKIRFHDLRHTAATNMHELTGDLLTVGMILGQSVRGVASQLKISARLDTVTPQYINVRFERIKEVLDLYHNLLHPSENETCRE
jgi:integrase